MKNYTIAPRYQDHDMLRIPCYFEVPNLIMNVHECPLQNATTQTIVLLLWQNLFLARKFSFLCVSGSSSQQGDVSVYDHINTYNTDNISAIKATTLVPPQQ